MSFHDLNMARFSEELHCEAAGIFLNNFNTILITVWSPNGDFNKFIVTMSLILDSINTSINIIITGDFNVHFLDDGDRQTLQLKNLFYSYGLSISNC